VVTRYSLINGTTGSFESLSIAFANVAEDRQLEPPRFKICKNCGNRFYQIKRATMQYCSGKCSVAGRSRKNYEKSKSQDLTIEEKVEIGRQLRKEMRSIKG
jgi:hypothetical protein